MKSIFAEIITIGDEILLGQITDTNSQWISASLAAIGVRVVHRTAVGDEAAHITAALRLAEQRADVILITGGLGPTKDDITKKTLAEYFGDTIVLNTQAEADLAALMASRGRTPNELTRLQSMQPSRAIYVKNPVGTAPAMWFAEHGKVFVSMPGVPFEMKEIMNTGVLPKLKETFQLPAIQHKIVRTIAYAESAIAEKIETWEDALPPYLKLAYLPSAGAVKLRLTGTGADAQALEAEMQTQINALLPLLEHHAYAAEDIEIEEAVGRLLKQKGLTLAAAESCTGGGFASMMTNVAGSSSYFKGSFVCYATEMKSSVLGIKPEVIQAHGVVSEQVVKEMAENARRLAQSDIGVACTGVAGPATPHDEAPVGTIWIAYADQHRTITKKLQLTAERGLNRHLTAMSMLNLIRLSV